jgi:membrane protease subunit (stomatin/prohibitin family)
MYTQLQAADAMRDAANAPGGNLAGAGVGIGAGVGLGQMMTQAMQGGQQSAQQPAAPAGDTVACPSCGHQNLAGAKFCSNCGTQIPASAGKQFCTQCGKEVPVGAKFCSNCGAKQ